MRTAPRKLWPALTVLLSIHGLALGAGYFAPYPSAEHNRALPFAPPTPLRILDNEGALHGRPFIYPWVEDADRFGEYTEDRQRPISLRFHTRRQASPDDVRFLGVDEPTRLFLLGSDRFGRDLFSRLLYGARVSLFAGLLAALLAVVLGLLMGMVAGYFGGWLDEGIMRLAEVFMALPWLYLLIAARAFLPLDVPPARAFLLIIAILGLIGWARPARLFRGLTLSLRERDFILAARGFGASHAEVLRYHVLPHVVGVAATQLALLVPQYILAEVTLSFLGLGVAEPVPSWGNMLSDLKEIHILTSYAWMFSPAFALVLVVLSYHALARALQARQGAAAL